MNPELIAKLASLFGGRQKPPPPDPNAGINEREPWNSEVLRPTDQDRARMPPSTPAPTPPAPGGGEGMNNLLQMIAPMIVAEQLKKQKQQAVGAGNMTGLINEPIPR